MGEEGKQLKKNVSFFLFFSWKIQVEKFLKYKRIDEKNIFMYLRASKKPLSGVLIYTSFYLFSPLSFLCTELTFYFIIF